MKEIRKIKVMSLAKVLMLFGALFGLMQGILMGQLSVQYANEGITLTLSEAVGYIAASPATGITPLFIAFGWWSILVAPIILGIGYFISGIILAWLYNMFAKFIGGIKIDIEDKDVKKKKK
jgi:hypothetical protein